jgi:small subunit ribosomal protein S8e
LVWHYQLKKRKKTGGKKRPYRTKRAHERGRHPIETELGDPRRKKVKGNSGIPKTKIITNNLVNVSDPESGLTERLTITDVIRNPANTDYNRRGVITKGTIIRTPKGLAKIVSRPGQTGSLNAVLFNE